MAKFEEAGPPQAVPLEQKLSMRLSGGRTGKRAIVVTDLELTGLMKPFTTEIWFGDRVAVLGSNGSGKSHFLRLLARGGSRPDAEHRPVGHLDLAPVAHTGLAKLGARVRPGWFAQTHSHPELLGRTLLEILHRGDDHRDGMGRELASRKLDRYELAHAAEQKFESLSGGQQARFQILLLELSGATLLLLDEPTDNLDIESAEALEQGLESFEGTVSRSPTTAGSPAASTGSWCSAPTAGSTSPTSRSGTSRGSSAPADRSGADPPVPGSAGPPNCSGPGRRSRRTSRRRARRTR